eukprot:CAMPEP_0174259196 /NCGR_PEP_ID=MMETSP0439-20130205/8060_1 /TAXON_ID=0 /ORGANISM="Stereomyxa ramosa, Strain Chinc5" /LENGTH=63 /DNA_ID=CAMNT_0015342991 /DNA_START=248 /DNA_END=435 /DNA_ORIENTATION=-
MTVTFHRAFDVLATDPLSDLDLLIELGVDYLLTSGRSTGAHDGIPLIKDLVSHSRGRIHIMAG